MASSSTSTIPITNSGSAASTSVVVDTRWSTGLSRRIAVHTPRTIESGTATTEASSTRNAELATRLSSRSPTGCCVAAETPRLPVSRSPSQLKYWLITGWSRLSCSRSAATRSGVASRPRIAEAASPGRASTAAKTISEIEPQRQHPEREAAEDELAHGRIPRLAVRSA